LSSEKSLSHLDSSFMLMFQLWFCTLLTLPKAYVKDTGFLSSEILA